MLLQPHEVSTLPGKTKNSANGLPFTAVRSVEQTVPNFRRTSFNLLENSFSSLLAENIVRLHGFLSEIFPQTQFG